jgi:hypothetical protein
MLAPWVAPHMDLVLRDSVSATVIGQARTAVISWSLPMRMMMTTWLTSVSMIAPREEFASLVYVSARTVGQACHVM